MVCFEKAMFSQHTTVNKQNIQVPKMGMKNKND